MLNWSHLKVLELHDNPLECSCDLFNISNALDESVKRGFYKPYCISLVDGSSVSLFALTQDICGYQVRIRDYTYFTISVYLAGKVRILVLNQQLLPC